MVPKIDVIADGVNKQTQSKGGLDITVVPVLYKIERHDKTTIQEAQPKFGEVIFKPDNQVFADQTTTPALTVSPKRIVFTIKIHNQLNRVFHGQGAVVQFNVDGKLIPFNNTDYKEFSGGIVPPLNDADLTIFGPPLELLHEKGTISIFLYDVITATDAAGNTTEKQNYTWDFTYVMESNSQICEEKNIRGLMSIGEFNRIKSEEQIQRQKDLFEKNRN
jgi:hypothetical protein